MSTNNVNGKIYANTDANSLSKSVDALREVGAWRGRSCRCL